MRGKSTWPHARRIRHSPKTYPFCVVSPSCHLLTERSTPNLQKVGTAFSSTARTHLRRSRQKATKRKVPTSSGPNTTFLLSNSCDDISPRIEDAAAPSSLVRAGYQLLGGTKGSRAKQFPRKYIWYGLHAPVLNLIYIRQQQNTISLNFMLYCRIAFVGKDTLWDHASRLEHT